MCRHTQKYINPLQHTEEDSLKSILIRLLFLKFDDIYVRYRMLSRIVCLGNGCTLPKLRVYRGTQDINNTLWSVKKKKIKSVLTWYDNQIKSNC